MLTATLHVCGDVTYGCKPDRGIPPSPPCPFSRPGGETRSRIVTIKILGVLALLGWGGCDPVARVERGIRMGLSKLSNLNSRPRQRSRAMKSSAKRRIKGAARILEAKYGAQNCSFMTLTIPDAIAWEIDASHWQKAWHLMQVKLRRRLKQDGLDLDCVSVYEVHPERSARNGVPILHIHAVFVGRKSFSSWSISPQELTDLWKETWVSQFPEIAPSLSWNSSTNIQGIRKSVSAYLGKYLATNKFDAMEFFSGNEYDVYFPRNWAMVGRKVLQLLRKNTTKFFGNDAFRFLEEMRKLAVINGWHIYKHFVSMPDKSQREVGGFIGNRILPSLAL